MHFFFWHIKCYERNPTIPIFKPYFNPTFQEEERVYAHTRAEGFGDEVKRRILMGTYALSAGYFDAYYRRAQQVASQNKYLTTHPKGKSFLCVRNNLLAIKLLSCCIAGGNFLKYLYHNVVILF